MTINLIPLAPGSKSPLSGESWKELVSADPDVHRDWRRDGLNVGFPAGPNNAVIVDFDEKEIARRFYREHRAILGPMVETRKGVHAFFSGDTRPRKLYLGTDDSPVGDIRAGPTYTVFPDSRVRGWFYQFIRGHEWGPLPPFQPDLFPDKRKEEPRPPPIILDPDDMTVRRARAYLTTVEGAVSGCRGHDKTLYAASALIQKFRLDIATALPLLLEWNQKCVPPWDEKSLIRKLREAERLKGDR